MNSSEVAIETAQYMLGSSLFAAALATILAAARCRIRQGKRAGAPHMQHG